MTGTPIQCKTPRRPLDVSVIVLPLFLLGFLLARFAAPVFMLLPACTFRAALGLPCPSCGMTRAGLALAQGEWLTAFAFNPLFVISIGILSLWSATQWLEMLVRKNFITRHTGKAQKQFLRVYHRLAISRETNHTPNSNRLRRLVIGAIGLNWLYLIISG